MNSTNISITPGGRASRVEVIVRIPYLIIFYIVAWILGIIMSILVFVNIVTCLLLAKRVGGGFIAAYVKWLAESLSYLLFAHDERPPLFPNF